MLLTLVVGLSSCSDSYLEDVNTDDSKAETIAPNGKPSPRTHSSPRLCCKHTATFH